MFAEANRPYYNGNLVTAIEATIDGSIDVCEFGVQKHTRIYIYGKFNVWMTF